LLIITSFISVILKCCSQRNSSTISVYATYPLCPGRLQIKLQLGGAHTVDNVVGKELDMSPRVDGGEYIV